MADHQPQPDDDAMDEEMGSETSHEHYESEDSGGRGYGNARTVYHAPRSDCDTANSTRSLYDSDVEYTYIHGRRYCQDYYLPNDLHEQNRWQMMHQIYLSLFEYALTTVPLESPKRILDIGCGTGEWALDMADQYPDAEIIGTDIAPIQPTKVPQNVFFEIDDAEIEGGWNFSQGFDLIHFRSMSAAFKDWKHIYQEVWKSLEPGGWIEVLDFDDHQGILEYFKEETVIIDWVRAVMTAMAKTPRRISARHLEPSILTSLGFVDVSVTSYDLPMGAWGESKEARSTSVVFLELQTSGLEAACLRTLVEYGGWKVDDVMAVCQKVRVAAKRRAGKPLTAQGCKFMVKVLKGRKPLEGEVPPAKEVGSAVNGFLAPGERDPDEESVLTVTKDNLNTVKGGKVNGVASGSGSGEGSKMGK